MAQGSRFSAPKFHGGGLWDPRSPGTAWPEPVEGSPYVKGTDGMSGCGGCGGTSGVGQIDFSKLLAPKITDLRKDVLSPEAIEAIKSVNLKRLDQSTEFLTPAVSVALQNIAKEEAEKKKKKKMLIIGGAVVLGVGLIFLANR